VVAEKLADINGKRFLEQSQFLIAVVQKVAIGGGIAAAG
jgi:hypothetical protein